MNTYKEHIRKFSQYYNLDYNKGTTIRLSASAKTSLYINWGRVTYINENNRWHRLDGPACISFKDEKYWYIDGVDITYQIKKWAKESDIDLDNLSDEDKTLIKLVWADYGKLNI